MPPCQHERETHRNSFRIINFKPDQMSSTAQTLISTSPCGRAMPRITSSVMSVATPELFFGHEIQITPLGSIAFRNVFSFALSADLEAVKQCTKSTRERRRGAHLTMTLGGRTS